MLTLQTAEEICEKNKQMLNSGLNENQSGLDQFAIFKLWWANIPQEEICFKLFLPKQR